MPLYRNTATLCLGACKPSLTCCPCVFASQLTSKSAATPGFVNYCRVFVHPSSVHLLLRLRQRFTATTGSFLTSPLHTAKNALQRVPPVARTANTAPPDTTHSRLPRPLSQHVRLSFGASTAPDRELLPGVRAPQFCSSSLEAKAMVHCHDWLTPDQSSAYCENALQRVPPVACTANIAPPVTTHSRLPRPLSQHVRLSFGASTAPDQTGKFPDLFVVPDMRPSGLEIHKATAPKKPSDLQCIVAGAVPWTPAALSGTLQQLPFREALSLEMEFPDSADDGRFAVFDVTFHARNRRRESTWSLLECVADAMASAGTRTRAVQVLTKPLHGLPLPQITLTPAHAPRGSLALPFDLRPIGLYICTLEVSAGMTLQDLLQAAAARCDRRGVIASLHSQDWQLRDALDCDLDRLLEPPSLHEWLSLVAREGPRAAAATTATSTMMEVDPPRLLGHAQGFDPERVSVPLILTGIEIGPPLVLSAPGASMPVGQLCMFEGLESGGKRTIPYHMFVRGYPPVLLFGSNQWPMVQFCAHAAHQPDTPPAHIRFLTVPLPGLPPPHIVVTEQEFAGTGTLMPIDLRALGLGIMPTVLEPEDDVRAILDRAAQLVPELHERLAQPWQEDRIYLQDCTGQVHERIPQDVGALQWLALRVIEPRTLPLELHAASGDWPANVPTTTTSTTAMQMPEQLLSFVIVSDGATVRSPLRPLSEVNVREVLSELFRGLLGVGRLKKPFRLQLAPIMPRATNAQHLIAPIIATTQVEGATVFMDPGTDGLQLFSMNLPTGSFPEDTLSEAQRRAGLQVFINGIPASMSRRPLETGDYVQQLLPTQASAGTRHFGPLLERIHELRFLTMPLQFPALTYHSGIPAPNVAALDTHRPLSTVLERILLQRAMRMGTPDVTRRCIWLMQPARAPHRIWLDTPLTPSPQQALSLLLEEGLLPSDAAIVDAASEAETSAAAIFLVVRPEAPYQTCLISDPISIICYRLVFLTPGSTIQLARLPAPAGMRYRPPVRFGPGALFRLSSTVGATEVTVPTPPPQLPPEAVTIALTSDVEEIPDSETEPAPGRTADGTSLVQLSRAPRPRRNQFAGTLKAKAADIETDMPARSIPTPFGRRAVRTQLGRREHAAAQARTPLRLAELLPHASAQHHPKVQLRLGVSADGFQDVFGLFGIDNLCSSVPDPNLLPPHVRQFVIALPCWAGGHCEALQLYVDGSYFPPTASTSARAGWAVCVLALSRETWYYAGYLASPAPCSGSVATLGQPVESSYEVELAALLHALAIAARHQVPTLIGYDNKAAGHVAFGNAIDSQDSAMSRACIELQHFLRLCDRQPAGLHIHSHKGHPANDLADSMARGAAAAHTVLEASTALHESYHAFLALGGLQPAHQSAYCGR